MSWWRRLGLGARTPPYPEGHLVERLAVLGWNEEATGDDMRLWRDARGDVLSLQDTSVGLPEISNDAAVQQWSRRLAEARLAGLIEARVVNRAPGAAASLIYKRLQKPAYLFTGMLLVSGQPEFHVWTVVAGEHGTTGMREAVITAELMSAGKLTIQDYESSWAQDPYDPAYCGVDRSVLRFVSDDECYDERFPDHPLSKVRKLLATLR